MVRRLAAAVLALVMAGCTAGPEGPVDTATTSSSATAVPPTGSVSTTMPGASTTSTSTVPPTTTTSTTSTSTVPVDPATEYIGLRVETSLGESLTVLTEDGRSLEAGVTHCAARSGDRCVLDMAFVGTGAPPRDGWNERWSGMVWLLRLEETRAEGDVFSVTDAASVSVDTGLLMHLTACDEGPLAAAVDWSVHGRALEAVWAVDDDRLVAIDPATVDCPVLTGEFAEADGTGMIYSIAQGDPKGFVPVRLDVWPPQTLQWWETGGSLIGPDEGPENRWIVSMVSGTERPVHGPEGPPGGRAALWLVRMIGREARGLPLWRVLDVVEYDAAPGSYPSFECYGAGGSGGFFGQVPPRSERPYLAWWVPEDVDELLPVASTGINCPLIGD